MPRACPRDMHCMTTPLGSAGAQSLEPLSLDQGTGLFRGHDMVLAQACLVATSHSSTAPGHVSVLCGTSWLLPEHLNALSAATLSGRPEPAFYLCATHFIRIYGFIPSALKKDCFIYLRLMVIPLQISHLYTPIKVHH